ncbi:hypothetical protein CRG98_027957 [Punica granatum]|nr:hypothetical protein CRG98_027957 [Punica granatum]
MLNGTQLGGQSIRLSWGRSPSNKQVQPEQGQWNGGYYGYPQGYETYGYAPPPQDLNMYYGGYPGYNYQQPASYQQPQQTLILKKDDVWGSPFDSSTASPAALPASLHHCHCRLSDGTLGTVLESKRPNLALVRSDSASQAKSSSGAHGAALVL